MSESERFTAEDQRTSTAREAVAALRAYADSLERAPNEPGTTYRQKLKGFYEYFHLLDATPMNGCERACVAGFADWLDKQPAPPPPDVQAWQPIETAPEKEWVIIATNNGIGEAIRYGSQWDWAGECKSPKIVNHWMPLPSPPQAK